MPSKVDLSTISKLGFKSIYKGPLENVVSVDPVGTRAICINSGSPSDAYTSK